MQKPTIIKQEKIFSNQNSKTIWWEEYIAGYATESDIIENEVFPFKLLRMNTFDIFNKIISNAPEIPKYECPYFKGVFYYGIMPTAIIAKDIIKYKDLFSSNYTLLDAAFDDSWNKNINKDNLIHIIDTTIIGQSVLGHGYKDENMYYDGYIEWKLFKVLLSNGDFLIVKAAEFSPK